MTIEIKGITYEPKFTFNSFKYMEDFNVNDLETLDATPFKIIPFVEILLMGAVNSNPKNKVSLSDVDTFIDEYIENDGSLTDLIEQLMGLLEESSFFKSLQKKVNN